VALTTLSAVKTFLKVSDTSEDTFLTQLQSAVEAAVAKLTQRQLESASYTAYLSGNWQPSICLREYPVTAVASVYFDPNGYYGQGLGAFPSTTLLVAGVDYTLRMDAPDGLSSQSGTLDRINGVWPGSFHRPPGRLSWERIKGQGNIKVAYTAGYTTIPDDLQALVWQAVGQLRASSPAGLLVTSESLGGYNYSLEAAEQAVNRVASAASILARYARKEVVVG
jgi:hypothetical protein